MIPNFRAWDNHFKVMYEVKSIVYTLGSMLCVNRNALYPERTLYFEDAPLMQSTGILDNNGVEIFEGDIIKATYKSDYYDFDREYIGEIKYIGSSWMVVSNSELMWLITDFDTNEVIGNIYENPELLEEG
ncbi:YopX family protein [Streptococcus jiangjianxini]|uniref:YopX family protein n=1 Tax=Streptococcus jiangjianxini TaxID=3161189 RepID=UPI0032EF4725